MQAIPVTKQQFDQGGNYQLWVRLEQQRYWQIITRDRDGGPAGWAQFPRAGVWVQRSIQPAAVPARLANWQFRIAAPNPNLAQHMANRAPRVRNLAIALKRIPDAQIEFVKCLGWGGMGVVSLFWFPADNNTKVLCVVKCALNGAGEKYVKREKKIQETYRHAMHIVQAMRPRPAATTRTTRRALNQIAPVPPAVAPAAPAGPLFAPAVLPVLISLTNTTTDVPGGAGTFREADLPDATLIMEYCQRKDLDRFLDRIGDSYHGAVPNAGNIPEQMLWMWFRCMVKSVIGLRHPPRPKGRAKFAVPQFTRLTETVPDSGVRHQRVVHFDIDPKNFFFGEYDTGEHPHIPVLKLGDFGLARKIGMDLLGDFNKMWGSRTIGKSNYRTPEQFTREWEYINYTPFWEASYGRPVPQVAGQYDWKMNLYQVAMTMEACITLYVPRPRRYAVQCAFPSPVPGNPPVNKVTFGSDLIQTPNLFPPYSDELRYLVAECLCELPADRPEPGDVLARIEARLAQPFVNPTQNVVGGNNILFPTANLNNLFDTTVGGLGLHRRPTQNLDDWLNGVHDHLGLNPPFM
ncbi:kinase-like domain-containing protein [Echria macrotheca]|uniref:Kinase-like domain-containing protein n=1 Tax=Echria macrotheca TaxID=438768 RepID=A0AAJ0B665_9PEZI|nr:kinase-like domain-containing protein [Echria macrotheca]